MSISENQEQLTKLGFSFKRGGAHSSRTMMLEEMQLLIADMDNPNASRSDYQHAIVEENCLAKRSIKTRKLTYGHLVDLYSLDPENIVFRTLLYFWNREPEGQALQLLLCVYARDTVFRSTAPFILNVEEGARVTRKEVEAHIDSLEPGRFSPATLRSTAQNTNSSWTKTGHLMGRNQKFRTRPNPTAGSVAYALFLAYLAGIRGQLLFQSEYIKLLDCGYEKALELAEEASRKGWIVFKRVGDVMEVLFPNLISAEELEWSRE